MTSTAPDWAETSVRWLQTNHPIYLSSRAKDFPSRLSAALHKMGYGSFTFGPGATRRSTAAEYRAALTKLARTWGRYDHESMVKFLDEGGYEGEKERRAAELAAASEAVVKVPVTDASGKVVSEETLEIELDELEAGLKPPSQRSPDHELEEIIQEAQIQGDPRYGVW